ncbi:Mfs1.1 [Mycena rebaudengoi]|nr:Mfs1.1 [Mycena rebaudengoi]
MSSDTSSPDVGHIPRRGQSGRGWRFWIIFLSVCLSLFLSALDLATISTALPVIVHDLHGDESFAWVSAAYTLASASVLPLSGRMADIFGRRIVLVSSLLCFTAGSIICACANSMAVLIAGRSIQGIGSGGIQALSAIIVADLVTLRERGIFNAYISATFSFASIIGPFIGGSIAQKTSWRWIFWINLPFCVLALGCVALFLKLRRPPVESLSDSLIGLDWVGNTLIIGGTASCIVALTWAGVVYSWSSPQVLAPILVGIFGLVWAIAYDAKMARNPSIPFRIISNRTSLSGYLGSFLHGIVIMGVTFYMPVYFQACKIKGPLLSGVYILPMALAISPSAIVQGIVIGKTGRYRLMNILGWCLMMLGIGLLSTLSHRSPIAITIPFQIITAVGFGFLYATTFSVLAPLDITQNSQALSFLLFARTFSQSWGIAVGATILQNQLKTHLPPAFLEAFATDKELAYTLIPVIGSLPQPVQDQVREVFSKSLVLWWRILIGVCGAGLLSVVFQAEIPLHNTTDEKWGMEEKKPPATVATGGEETRIVTDGRQATILNT